MRPHEPIEDCTWKPDSLGRPCSFSASPERLTAFQASSLCRRINHLIQRHVWCFMDGPRTPEAPSDAMGASNAESFDSDTFVWSAFDIPPLRLLLFNQGVDEDSLALRLQARITIVTTVSPM